MASSKIWYKNFPWRYTLTEIKSRCNNPNNTIYKYYGGKGIKCQIMAIELEELWFRDKAYMMKKPSIDRIDNDGNYELRNCRYIELSKNVGKRNSRILKKSIVQYDLNDNIIGEWDSLKRASERLNIRADAISKALRGTHKTSGGFIWKYKKEEINATS